MAEWKTEVDGETIVRSCCWSPPGCHPVGCGVRLHVRDGKLVKIEGDPEHYVTKGALCPRGLAGLEYIYHPDRIIYPMKRAKEDRGKDKWERCTWEEALDLIETNAKAVIAEHGAESILVFGGTGREANYYYSLIAHVVFGSPNSVYAQSGWSCYGPRCTSTGFMMGGGYPEIDYAQKFADRYDHPDYKAPEYIILWGKEPLKSNPDGFWGHSIIEMKRRFGTKICSVDPRITWLGTRCDDVIQVRPGTDTALAMAMLNVITGEDLVDHDFIDKWCAGYEELKERVKEMPPSKAAEICGVDEEQIIRVARAYATARPGSIGWGLAVDQNPNGVQLGQCLIAMMGITGCLDVPGGTILGVVDPAQVQMDASQGIALRYGIMDEAMWNKRIGTDTFPAMTSFIPTAAPDAVLDALETGIPYFPHMGFFSSSNVIGAAITAAPQRWYEALKKMDFNVVTDTFMNPTAMALCDVFLPVASYAEHNAMVLTHYGFNASFFGAVNKAVQVGECKSDVEIMLEVGKRMHPEFWGQYEDDTAYNEANGLNGKLTWNELAQAVTIPTEEPYRKYELGLLRADREPGFASPSHKLELASSLYAYFGDDPLPYYKEPPYGPISTPDLFEDYPLVLTTGARTYVSFHSEHRQIPSLRQVVPDPLLDIHPTTAANLGIGEGDWVWIESPFGKCKQRAHVTATIKPDVVHAMHGWWFPEEDGEEPNLYGNWKSNINVTMPHKVNGKMGFGDCFKNNICKVYKVEE